MLPNTETHPHQSLAVLQQVIDHTQAGLLFARPVRNEAGQVVDFRYILTNEYNARVTGKSVAEMTDTLIADLFPGWQDSDLFRMYVAVIETGETRRVTFPYEAFGMKGWFDGTFTCIDDCLLYTYTDVTALKEAELIQQRQAELLEQVMNATLTGIVVHESVYNDAGELIDFRLTQLNQMAANLLGGSIESIQNQLLSRYFPTIQQTPVFENYRKVLQTGKPIRFELPYRKGWYDLSVTRLGRDLVIVVQEITHMHVHQQQLEQANHELKRSNESLKSFAYIASHDLQEPLRKMTSFTDILHTGHAGQFNTETTDIIRRINESAERMRMLIHDLLTYSQVEVATDSFQSVPLQLLVQELADVELWGAIEKTGAQLTVADLPTVSADPVQMRQLFQNLISNAIKFGQPDQTCIVTVSCRPVSRTELPANLLVPNLPKNQPTLVDQFYEISVTDNGIGFDEKYLDRIFQIFQRLHGRNKYPGSGIGLAICQRIVERHGGVITAMSQPDKGSTFQVYLPVLNQKV